MGLFDFLRPRSDPRKLLVDQLLYNADIIQRDEGKPHYKAEYLAACLIIDDLSKRANGREGYRVMMEILQADFPKLFREVVTYVGWSIGKLHFKPEYEAYVRARHSN